MPELDGGVFSNAQILERGKPQLFCSPGSPLPKGSLATSPGGCTSTDEEESFVTVTSLDRTRHRHLEDTFHSVVTSPQSEAAFKSVNQVWSLKVYSSISLIVWKKSFVWNRRCFELKNQVIIPGFNQTSNMTMPTSCQNEFQVGKIAIENKRCVHSLFCKLLCRKI